MKQHSVLIFGTMALAFVTVWTAGAQAKDDAANYRSWTQVNEKPLQMPSWVDVMCAQTPKLLKLSASDPHSGKFFVVYVNEVGRNAMLTQAKPEFPRGTVIVKEKLPLARKQRTEWTGKPPYPKPEVLTMMRKREKRYFPKGGDWEYIVMDGTGQKTLKSGRLDACASCHDHYKATDFVTRNYLPDKIVRQLYPKREKNPH